MSITVYFLRKDDGRPDQAIAARYFESAEKVLQEAVEFRASARSQTHLMQIGGDMSLKDEQKLLASGLVVSSGAYLPSVGKLSV